MVVSRHHLYAISSSSYVYPFQHCEVTNGPQALTRPNKSTIGHLMLMDTMFYVCFLGGPKFFLETSAGRSPEAVIMMHLTPLTWSSVLSTLGSLLC